MSAKTRQLRGKMQGYAEARAQGLAPMTAGAHAGYSGGAMRVTLSRIEARSDVQAEIRRLKKGDKRVDEAPVTDTGDREPWVMKDKYESPLALMEDVMNNPLAPKSLRYQAAKDALPYCHARKEGGKKDEVEAKAKEAAGGKFKTGKRPSARPHVH